MSRRTASLTGVGTPSSRPFRTTNPLRGPGVGVGVFLPPLPGGTGKSPLLAYPFTRLSSGARASGPEEISLRSILCMSCRTALLTGVGTPSSRLFRTTNPLRGPGVGVGVFLPPLPGGTGKSPLLAYPFTRLSSGARASGPEEISVRSILFMSWRTASLTGVGTPFSRPFRTTKPLRGPGVGVGVFLPPLPGGTGKSPLLAYPFTRLSSGARASRPEEISVRSIFFMSWRTASLTGVGTPFSRPFRTTNPLK